MLNAGWLIAAWSLTTGGSKPNVLLIGTDPILSVLVAAFWRLTRRRVRIAHWGFDLYPEAPVADGMLRPNSLLVRCMKRALRIAYRCCDLIADLGGCMREQLQKYDHRARSVTLVPWALAEPSALQAPDPATRLELFGDAKLALLYSGNFGRAHSYSEFLDLARALRGESVSMCFAVRGNRADELRRDVTADDVNIRFAGFAPESELEKRLGAADIHLVSLRPEWTGVVVPSKFFGSLAAGRPVIFAGDPRSALARWIQEFGVGWLLAPETINDVARELRQLSRSPERLATMQQRCHSVYHEHFSQRHVLDQWDEELRRLLPRTAGG
jgi:glycosyltransferase involved in cell wall biosynthesis